MIIVFWYISRKAALPSSTRQIICLLLITAFVQVGLGIVTLILAVPVSLGVLPQVVAVVLFMLSLLVVHRFMATPKYNLRFT